MEYKLDVIDVSSGEGGDCLLSKGHHDDAEFLAACAAERDITGWDQPRKLWMRVVPGRPGDDHKSYYADATPGARGAFPVTLIERD